MRHLTSGSRYKLFLKLVVVGVLFFWAVTLFTASPQGADTSRLGALELLSMSSLASASTPTTADDRALHRLEADYARERQERLELQRSIEQLQTKQQDLQGQLDILRQQMPLPEDQVEGAAKPPEIGYTKWAKNYYNTRRDDAGSGPDDSNNKNDNEQQQDNMDSINLSSTGIELPRLKAETEEGEARRKKAQADGLEESEGGQCVLPQALDYKKDFWGGRPFAGCCRGGNCGRYQLRDRGRLLLSKCDEPATISWAKETRTVAPDQLFSLSTIPQVGSLQYVKFKCKELEELVVVPMTNEKAYEQVLARNLSSSSIKPNVVVMMIDAVSRAQFVRAMPKTLQFFQNLNSEPGQRFSVFDFQFFGTLGAYSPPNRYAFFSGYPFVDDQAFFDGSPFPQEQKVLRVNERKGVWMWDVLSEQGYITYSARDMCSKTAAFVYDDFVSRPWTDVHFQEIYCDHRYKMHASSSEHCLSTRYAHQYVLDSGLLFHETYTGVPRFTYLDFAEGHEPSMRIVRTMDNDLVEQLPRYLSDGNTIVVLASDHGIGYGKQHVTKDGPLEERLPALYVIAPNKVLTKESRANLERNTQKLVSGTDVYETVADFVGAAGARPWAHSLLRPMPSRTCKEAGINVHACPCSLWDGGATKSRITWK